MQKIKLKIIYILILSIILMSGCSFLSSGGGKAEPTAEPSPTETAAPTDSPTAAPTAEPSAEPTTEPSAEPSAEPTAEASPEPTVEPVPGKASEPDPNVTLRGTEDMGQEYIDNIIFLGDSTTYGMKYYGVLKDGKNTKQVWTPSNGTLTLSYQGFVNIVYPDTGKEMTIRDAVKEKKPVMMVITLGVNGISFMDKDYFIAEYTNLVEDIMEISPDTKVILQSIFPVAKSYEKQESINNKKICEANTWVQEVCAATGAKYLDTQTVLTDNQGFLNEDYSNGDGLHLNTDGFNIVLDYIRTHGYK